ncbi:hypothetical protein DOTSEDRAFT_136966 [Dothistroma septosporum NZE10]|uniref:General transcription and DNA repair factor IIH subunit TFB4 n=1 Tax=Dothistroma septosporum (strain NZE10 / CBS 128990) TaxID=675120 RepID=N1PGV9_DOTSN|nr:hypothetical protein DOTSEDRAFT_136966 [Dothistroma septosporum NZE10]
MNAVDATERADKHDESEPPSLLTIILDTNPHAWALHEGSLPLSKAVASLLVFINAHLAIHYGNKVAVIASHAERAEFLYPAPATAKPHSSATDDVDMGNGDALVNGGPVRPPDDANKYRPFAHIEHALTHNLRDMMDRTSPAALSTPSTMLAGALTMALTYISKQSAALPTANSSAQFNYSDPSAVAGGSDLTADGSRKKHHGLRSRILILSVSGDLADQYISIMNAIFACQRMSVPIDILKLAGDTVFLQQAADATGGVYVALDEKTRAGFLQYLMFAYLPDQTARAHLIMPGEGEGVDFRAACFCHRKVVDTGYVCSICLSIFCEPLHDGTCLTCGSHLTMSTYGQKPIAVPKRKKKKKRPLDGAATDSRGGTPLPP